MRSRNRSTRIIAIAAQKGGVGKTTTAVNLGRALHEAGHAVLVVDLDPQAAATSLLAEGMETERGTPDVLLEGAPLLACVVPTASGLDLLGASPALEVFDVAMASRRGREALLRGALAQALAEAPGRWDFVLLDCPPSLGLLTVNALACAHYVLTPCMAAFLPLRSIGPLTEAIGHAVVINPALRHLGFLLCAVDEREAITDETRQLLRTQATAPLWKTEIRIDAKLRAGPGARKGRGARDYAAAAAELVRRLRAAERAAAPQAGALEAGAQAAGGQP